VSVPDQLAAKLKRIWKGLDPFGHPMGGNCLHHLALQIGGGWGGISLNTTTCLNKAIVKDYLEI